MEKKAGEKIDFKKCIKRCIFFYELRVLSEFFFSQINIYWSNIKNVKIVCWVLTLKMIFAPTFIVIFVISKSKYVGIRSFKAIGGVSRSEVHPKMVFLYIPNLHQIPKTVYVTFIESRERD